MKRFWPEALIATGFFVFGWVIGDTIRSHKPTHNVDWFCGTITFAAGTREPVKISVENEMSFDLRSAPGLLYLYRCEVSTPISSIK